MFSFYGKSFHGAHFAEPTVFLNNLFPKVDPCPIMLKLELICTFTEGHWGRTGWTSAYHGDMDDPAHQSLG